MAIRYRQGEIRRMNALCCGDGPKFDGVSSGFKRALWAVIFINGFMFLVEMTAGAFAESKALQADALDFLGDTATYALSLYVIGMSLKIRATAALFKGLRLGAMGAWVLGTTIYQVLVLGTPQAEVMGVIGFLALIANLCSVAILMRYKDGDANVRSVWLCSRNDAIAKVSSLFYLVPPIVSITGYFLFGETFGILAIVGMVIALAGVMMVKRS